MVMFWSWKFDYFTLLVDNDVIAQFQQFHGFKAPCHKFEVMFGEDITVELGMTLDIQDVNTNVPTVKYSKAKSEKIYDLVMFDYDRFRNNEADYWLITLIVLSGNALKEGTSNNVDLNGKHTYFLYKW